MGQSNETNIADNLSRWAREKPYAVAVIGRRRLLNFAAFDRAVWKAAAWFCARGLRADDVVATTLGDSVGHLVSAFALARLGAVRLQLPRREAAAYRERLARAYGAVALLTERGEPGLGGLRLLHPDGAWFDADGAPTDASLRAQGGDRSWAIVLTSGTTDAPKAIRHSHAAYVARRAVNQGPHFFLPTDRYLAAMPLDFHLGFRMCLDALWFGATVAVGGPYETTAALYDAIDRLAISFVYLTPVVLHQMLPGAPTDGARFPGLRVLRTGGMVLTPAVREQVLRRLSPNFVNGYGLNDLDCAIAAADGPTQERHPGSVGLPLPGVELEVVDAAGRPLPAGEPGELRFRVPQMPEGYIGHPDATRRAFREGWFYPGDVGVLDAAGLLYLKGRADDMMNFDGIKIFPADIESALLEHPAVAEATAFGIESERHQHLPAAAVSLRAAVAMPELLAWCRERLGKRAPVWIAVLDALPRNAMGKVVKRDVVARALPMFPGERL
jgi:acyl-CoA synthetase (AMP-forming)/AMP-acid ligase II